ncbi:cupredoxin domain-containing protein [Chelativorans intermedius]|uniref:Cupredoxin family protein n=1 Tax=Chelativorans intermedius TaxID=515947 RepID=A0ABV6DC49_9HYPH|nr:cupredoxin family protein [Chelativorans intermedius]MCT9000322.1 cupredoxin family protein [Chelativorans intermedius]
MKRLIMAVASMAALTSIAYAGGNHADGHGEADMMAIGKPGEAAAAGRSVTITMKENDDGAMVFEPASLKIEEGETIRLTFVNEGELEHEFVMDVHESILEHKALMEKFPEMEHDDPNAVRLGAGAKGEIVWTFAKAGEFEFACLIPGHYESGMKGDIIVTN